MVQLSDKRSEVLNENLGDSHEKQIYWHGVLTSCVCQALYWTPRRQTLSLPLELAASLLLVFQRGLCIKCTFGGISFGESANRVNLLQNYLIRKSENQ